MKIAIMQPYFYPYIGYFELIKSVDHFVFLDDAQYTKGWINRNRIRSQSKIGWSYLTIPINQHPINTPINQITTFNNNWKKKHYETLKRTYKKQTSHPLFNYLQNQPNELYIINILYESIKYVSNFLNLTTKFSKASELNCIGKGQERIINICLKLKATEYYNLPGGRILYDEKQFISKGLKLNFLELTKNENKLSIIDCILGDNLTSLDI